MERPNGGFLLQKYYMVRLMTLKVSVWNALEGSMSSQPLLESAFKAAFCRQNLPSYGAVEVAEELGYVKLDGFGPPYHEGASCAHQNRSLLVDEAQSKKN